MRKILFLLVLLLSVPIVAPARAGELFAGFLVHDVETPLSLGGLEDGAEVQFGWRGEPIRALRAIGSPSPHVFGAVALSDETHYAAAGLSWRFGGRLFVRPGVGLAVHSRSTGGVANGVRTDLGSRILFAPEIGVGWRIAPRWTIEASLVHLSHGQFFGGQNPGQDSVGLRLSYRLR